LRARVRFFGAGAVVAVLAGTFSATVPARADAGRLDPQQVRGSIAYLRKAYGVTEREALRRLELQRTAVTLAATLEKQAAGSYAGVWLDQADGGRLILATTSPPAVAGLLRGLPDREHIMVKRVSHSLAELRAGRDRLASELGDGPDSIVLPRVSESANEVVAWRRDWLVTDGARTRAAQNVTALDRAVARSGGMVVARSLPKPHQLTTSDDFTGCHPLYCLTYGGFRGGMRLEVTRDDDSTGVCTSGFNVRARGGAYDGRAFVLTAGHCVVGGRHLKIDYASHQGKLLLREEPGLARNDTFPYDYALLSFINVNTQRGWVDNMPEHNLVLFQCATGSLDNDTGTPCKGGSGVPVKDGKVRITGVTPADQVHANFVVCATGAGASAADFTDAVESGAGQGYLPGTRCGLVTGQSNGGIDTDICARPGDSGGPLFDEASGAAVGILEGSVQSRTGPCQLGESNNYLPVSAILSNLNGQPAAQGSTFSVITTARG
jgi:streptogrisin C